MAAVTPLMVAQVGMGLMATHRASQQAKAQSNAARNAYQTRANEINAQQKAEERRRQETLDRESATQRARFGALGISSAGGSSAAVLNGLQTNSDAESADRARQLGIARDRSSQAYSNSASSDLLAKKSAFVQDNLSKVLTW
mgnify:CR=1 FL=1